MGLIGNYKRWAKTIKAVIKFEKDILSIAKTCNLTEDVIWSEIEKLKSDTESIKHFVAIKGRFPNKNEDNFISKHGIEHYIKINKYNPSK